MSLQANQYDNYNNDFAKERGWIATRDNVIRYIRFNMEQFHTPKDIHDECPEAKGEFEIQFDNCEYPIDDCYDLVLIGA